MRIKTINAQKVEIFGKPPFSNDKQDKQDTQVINNNDTEIQTSHQFLLQ